MLSLAEFGEGESRRSARGQLEATQAAKAASHQAGEGQASLAIGEAQPRQIRQG